MIAETLKHQSYRQMLLREYELRKKRNPMYSMRAFAASIGIQASKLSEILNLKKGLSTGKAQQIAEALHLSEKQKKLFFLFVEAEHSRSRRCRLEAQKKLRLQAQQSVMLDLEKFKLFSDWYHIAILEMVDIASFKNDPQWIAEELSINVEDARNALQRLAKFNLIQIEHNKIKKHEPHIHTSDDIPSIEIQNFHRDILGLADGVLKEKVDVNAREFQSLTFAFPKNKVREAKREIRGFLDYFNEKFLKENQENDSLYCLSVQFFPMNKQSKTNGRIL